jgi:hypothetical protein
VALKLRPTAATSSRAEYLYLARASIDAGTSSASKAFRKPGDDADDCTQLAV